MTQHPGIRDYLYVSRTRVERLAASLPPKVLARLTSANLQLGPVGGGVSLAPAETKILVEAIAEVEPEIRKKYRVRTADERPLEPGMWIESRSLLMAYGTPRGIATTLEAALFTSVHMQSRILLAGSVSGLLDRSHPSTKDPAAEMSNPQSIGDLLRSVRVPEGSLEPVTTHSAWTRHGFPITQLHTNLEASSGLFPMSFLAMVIQTSTSDRVTNIIAQPLYVAVAPPV